MKAKSIAGLSLAVAALIAFSPLSQGQRPEGSDRPQKERPERGERGERGERRGRGENPLHEAMDGLKNAQRAMRPMVEDPAANVEALHKNLAEMDRYCNIAYNQEPPRPEQELSEKEWALHQIAYKQSMLTLQGDLLNLRKMLIEGKFDEFKTAYSDLNKSKKSAHDQFKFD
ncbi:MAG: cytochrome b562 [Planctomycetota bacterium]